ncbi:MAG: hypothetical protein D6701_06095 [Gemmatimonadetes bacterium]|nr:MAG: hypothetical protein D6701_06095 [Gemmatimonadota bacterium]
MESVGAHSEDRARDFLIKLAEAGSPVSFDHIASEREGIDLDAIRRAIWELVEEGELAFTDDRQLIRGAARLKSGS